jgi:hypothetical protein
MWGVKIGSVKAGRVRIGARHVRLENHWLDKLVRPRALRPMRVPLLSAIAGMAHSILKSGAATRNGVAFRASTEGPATTGAEPFGRRTISPVIV